MALIDFVQFVKEEAEFENDPARRTLQLDVLKKERKKNGLLEDNNRGTRSKHQGQDSTHFSPWPLLPPL